MDQLSPAKLTDEQFEPMADDARVEAMLDTYEIRDLAQRYAVGVSFGDVDAIAELFDPEVDNGAFGPGREGTRRFYENFFRTARAGGHAQLIVGTHQVDLLGGDVAAGVVFTRSWSGSSEKGWGDTMVVYFDTYRKRDGRWGFVHRKETIHAAMQPHTDELDLGDSAAATGRNPLPRAWEYWDRWKDKLATGAIGRERTD
ncbi:MAG: nuclear transport factor 2 family protein [Acidobacteria bacterium]|nr:nuclear transport factor 2 family protein [Acidobacteriota bacterium]